VDAFVSETLAEQHLLERFSCGAINEAAASFYEYHGFTAVPSNRLRLVQKISDIAAALDG
jgi:hypothetical protein